MRLHISRVLKTEISRTLDTLPVLPHVSTQSCVPITFHHFSHPPNHQPCPFVPSIFPPHTTLRLSQAPASSPTAHLVYPAPTSSRPALHPAIPHTLIRHHRPQHTHRLSHPRHQQRANATQRRTTVPRLHVCYTPMMTLTTASRGILYTPV